MHIFPLRAISSGQCTGKPSCLAVMVDSPGYDLGLNEAIVHALANPFDDTVSSNLSSAYTLSPPGIQIIYGNVAAAVALSEASGVPLLTCACRPTPSPPVHMLS